MSNLAGPKKDFEMLHKFAPSNQALPYIYPFYMDRMDSILQLNSTQFANVQRLSPGIVIDKRIELPKYSRGCLQSKGWKRQLYFV